MPEHAEQKGKEPHFISPQLLAALGGVRKETAAGLQLIEGGEFVWGVEGVGDREIGKGVFKHVLLVSRVAYTLAKELKEKGPRQYRDLDLGSVVEIALLHDVVKLYAQQREDLSDEQKAAAGIRRDLKETDPETEEVGASWLKDLGFPKLVTEGIKDHFPQQVIDNPYWKIGLVADYLASQEVMSLEERLTDVKKRWIDDEKAEGKLPRIDPAVFEHACRTIREVAHELFTALDTTDKKFIEEHRLDDPESATRWEKFLMRTRERKREALAKKLVRRDSESLSRKKRADDPDSN